MKDENNILQLRGIALDRKDEELHHEMSTVILLLMNWK
jgi:hypothetical protein